MRFQTGSAHMTLFRALLISGIVLGLPSIWETLSFSWDPTFQAPMLRYGPTHTNYHAFREFTLTVGALLVMFYVMFQPVQGRTRAMWVAMAIAALFYYGGWWLPWPLLGLHTPTLFAELVHEAAAFTSGLAVVLSFRHYPASAPGQRVPIPQRAS